jgi:hypothetical protein
VESTEDVAGHGSWTPKRHDTGKMRAVTNERALALAAPGTDSLVNRARPSAAEATLSLRQIRAA